MARCDGDDLKKRGVEHDMFGRRYEKSDDPSGAALVLVLALIIVAIAVALLVMLR